MTQLLETPAQRRASRQQGEPNALRKWFARKPRPMSKKRFAELLGVTGSYVSQLCSDRPPWPGRDLVQRIGIVTEGEVTPNDLAGYPPSDD